jgi:hypothetical protein
MVASGVSGDGNAFPGRSVTRNADRAVCTLNTARMLQNIRSLTVLIIIVLLLAGLALLFWPAREPREPVAPPGARGISIAGQGEAIGGINGLSPFPPTGAAIARS